MGVPFLLPGDLPKPGIKPRSPALQADSLPSGPLGKPNIMFKFTAVFLKICNWPYWILYVKMWMPCSLSFLDIRSISLGDTALITQQERLLMTLWSLSNLTQPNRYTYYLWNHIWGLWRRKWQPTPVLLPGKSHGQRAKIHKVAKSWTWLSDFTFFSFFGFNTKHHWISLYLNFLSHKIKINIYLSEL